MRPIELSSKKNFGEGSLERQFVEAVEDAATCLVKQFVPVLNISAQRRICSAVAKEVNLLVILALREAGKAESPYFQNQYRRVFGLVQGFLRQDCLCVDLDDHEVKERRIWRARDEMLARVQEFHDMETRVSLARAV